MQQVLRWFTEVETRLDRVDGWSPGGTRLTFPSWEAPTLPQLIDACPENRHDRTETWSEENPDGRFRRFDVKDILERDKTSLDLFWIKDKSLADLDSLPAPDELAADIIENLQSALESFQELQAQLGK